MVYIIDKIRTEFFEVEDFVRSTRRWYRQGKPERCRRSVRLPEGSSSFSYTEFYSHWSFWSVVFLCLFSRKKRALCWTSYKWVFFPYDENQVINILFCKNAFLHKWGKVVEQRLHFPNLLVKNDESKIALVDFLPHSILAIPQPSRYNEYVVKRIG